MVDRPQLRLGFVLILMRWAPRMDWLRRTRPADDVLTRLIAAEGPAAARMLHA